MTATAPHLVIRASAGTGKTFQLTNRYLDLIASGVPPEQALATTFARKAAGEILDRVLVRLASAARDPSECAALASHLRRSTPTPHDAVDLLRRLLRNVQRLRVGTLDGFFVQLATCYTLELGLPAGWGIVDELTERRLRSDAIHDLIAAEETGTVVRLMHLLAKGEVRRSVAEQLREVVGELYEVNRETSDDAWERFPRFSRPSDDEINAAVERLEQLPLSGKQFPNKRSEDLNRFRDEKWDVFLTKGVAAKVARDEPKFGRSPIPDELRNAYEPLVAHAKSLLFGQLADRLLATRRLVSLFHEAYETGKRRQRGLRFDDVTRALAGSTATVRIGDAAYRLDGQLRHLLLDEFQDTSRSQWQVLRRFAERITSSAGDEDRTLLCVGDVKQAIYGWRGGVSEIFDAVENDLSGLRTTTLAESRRSGPIVVETVNRVFETIATNPLVADRPAVARAWDTRFETHSTALPELAGHASLTVAPRAEDQRTQTLATAADLVARLHAKRPGTSIGVLVRRNDAVGRMIYELRSRHRLTASEEGGNPLVDSAAVQLVLSLLKIADHPDDRVARFHVATSPIGEAVGLPAWQDVAAARLLSLSIRESLVAEGYGRTIHSWARLLAATCDDRELNRLLQLVDLARGYDARSTLRPRDFVREVETVKVEDPTAADVRVMTVHQAKGLEFDVVVLPELDVKLIGQPPSVVAGRPSPTDTADRVYPWVNQDLLPLLPDDVGRVHERYRDRVLNESLCVLYVALTRAVHAMHVVVAPSRENEKAVPVTFTGLLRHAFGLTSPLQPETTPWEIGDASWRPSRPPGTTANESPETEPITLRLKPTERRRRGWERRSPSSLEGGPRVRLDERLADDDDFATTRGSLFHAWFEAVTWLEDGPPDDDLLQRIATRFRPTTGKIDVRAERDRFRRMLDQPHVQRWLSRAGYDDVDGLPFPEPVRDEIAAANDVRLHVWRERSFAVREGDQLLSGTIDRVVLLEADGRPLAADIVDFKTDSVPDAFVLADKVAEYRPQLQAYASAVANLTGLVDDRIATRLLFVGPGRIVAVEAG